MKQRRPEGRFNDLKSEWKLGDPVEVRLEQRIPPGGAEGEWEWKDTGVSFLGMLMHGPKSRLGDPDNGAYWNVLPTDVGADGKTVGVCGDLAPVQITGEAFDPYADTEKAGKELIRFVIEHAVDPVEQQ